MNNNTLKTKDDVGADSLFISRVDAETILNTTSEVCESLFKMLRESQNELPSEEFQKLLQGVCDVQDLIYKSIDQKIYINHKDLIPEELKAYYKNKS